MVKILERFSKLFFGLCAATLLLLAASLVGILAFDVLRALSGGQPPLVVVLHSIGLITIAVAVVEVAKFLLEEEIIRDRELRSITDVRFSLTKFFTIIVIVISIEGLVMVFEVKTQEIQNLIYPTILLSVAVLALIGLGMFRRLTDPRPETIKAREKEEELVRERH